MIVISRFFKIGFAACITILSVPLAIFDNGR